jgi:hypothetical protein
MGKYDVKIPMAVPPRFASSMSKEVGGKYDTQIPMIISPRKQITLEGRIGGDERN